MIYNATGRDTGTSVDAVDWHERAACRGMAGLHDAREGREVMDGAFAARFSEARGVCRGCPVMEQCGAKAVATRAEGIWAGEYFSNGKVVPLPVRGNWRLCVTCGEPMPQGRRDRVRTCSETCRRTRASERVA